jgi:hypothetical protein
MMRMDYFTKNDAIHMPQRKPGKLFEMGNSLFLLVQDMHHTAFLAYQKRMATVRVVPRGLDRFDSHEKGKSRWAWNTSISDAAYTNANATNEKISDL